MTNLKGLPLLALSVALTATAVAAPVKANTIAGKITDWPAGTTGEVRLLVMSGMPNWLDETVLAKASVDKNGNFSLKLPDAPATEKVLPDAATMGKLAYSLPFGDSNSLMNLSSAARVNLFQLVAYGAGKRLDTVKFSSTPRRNLIKGDSVALLAYSSANTTLTSELSGFHRVLLQSSQQVWNVPLSKGWNWVTGRAGTFEATNGLWPISYSAAELPKEVTMRLQEGVSGLGVVLQTVDPSRETNITSVLPGSPAAASGLQAGDVLLKWDGKLVYDADDAQLIAHMLHSEVGTPALLTIRRGSQTLDFTIKRALLPASVPQSTF